MNLFYPGVLLTVAVLLIAGFLVRRHRQRRHALAKPFPGEWTEIVERNLPPYLKLSEEMQRQLQQYTQEFLYDKSFEGCGGLVLDDEIRVTIASQASLLLLNRKVRCYPKLCSVLVYPSTYV
ncbi:MAG: hypothetical protein EP304_00240, partial [Deltaproteobacteria bacterium]